MTIDKHYPIPLSRYVAIIATVWICIIAGSCLVNIRHVQQQAVQLATNEALTSFNKDTIYRQWVAGHGGVYVPVTEKTPPNPYLSHVAERDIVTPSGRNLTLINPAYMTRQVFELGESRYTGKGHLTSLKPLRPENSPDLWEAEALRAFEQGAAEVFAITETDGQQYFRLMRPFMTEKGCLKCHEQQGYKVGDIRGGISVSVPFEPYTVIAQQTVTSLVIWHLLIFSVGVIALALGTGQVRKRLRESTEAKKALAASEEKFRDFFENANDLIHSLDKEGRLLYTNRLWRETLGYTEDEVRQMKIFDIVDRDCESKCVSLFERLMRGEKTEPTETVFVAKDGRKIMVEGRCNPRLDGGNAVELLGIFRDVTARKQAEEEIKILRGILPICASCKKIRDDKGYWNQIETYIKKHSEADFTHSICPACATKLYPEEYEEYETIYSKKD